MRPILLHFFAIKLFFICESFRICPFVPDVFMVLGSFARILRLITAYFPYFNIYFALLSHQLSCLWQPFGNIFRKSREILWQLGYLRGYFYKYNAVMHLIAVSFSPSCAACVVCIICVACVIFVALFSLLSFLCLLLLIFLIFCRVLFILPWFFSLFALFIPFLVPFCRYFNIFP